MDGAHRTHDYLHTTNASRLIDGQEDKLVGDPVSFPMSVIKKISILVSPSAKYIDF